MRRSWVGTDHHDSCLDELGREPCGVEAKAYDMMTGTDGVEWCRYTTRTSIVNSNFKISSGM